jgi:hypothetical protein
MTVVFSSLENQRSETVSRARSFAEVVRLDVGGGGGGAIADLDGLGHDGAGAHFAGDGGGHRHARQFNGALNVFGDQRAFAVFHAAGDDDVARVAGGGERVHLCRGRAEVDLAGGLVLRVENVIDFGDRVVDEDGLVVGATGEGADRVDGDFAAGAALAIAGVGGGVGGLDAVAVG